MAEVTMQPCGDCGMPCTPAEYHPYAACLMFKACHNSATVRANLPDYEALRKRCEAVEARVAMAMHVLDKIDAGLGGETDDVRDALDPNEAIAAAQEPSHG